MDPLEPQPPRPVPPAPPRPELIAPAPQAAPPALGAQGVAPVIDFFSRRVDALERELAAERERAQTAQNMIAHQEALKNEVDAHLKALTDQLRREKLERDGEESRSHSRGRVEALEKRLDEMNATFAQLLKDAVAQRDSAPSSGALAAELSAFRAALKDGMDGVARWRGELRELSALVPTVQGLAERLPQDEKNFEGNVGRRLDEFSARIARALEDWKRTQEAERAELSVRVEALARERADLGRAWEAQARALREEQLKDAAAREATLSRQVGDLSARLTELAAAQKSALHGTDSLRQGLERTVSILTATPRAKDSVISELEQEKIELLKIARDRQDALRRFAEERRAIEKSMGDDLLKLTAQLEDERARTRAAENRAAEALGPLEIMKARLGDMERAVSDRDARMKELEDERDIRTQQLAGDRDELTRALVSEAEKVHRGIAERRDADAAAEARLSELSRRLEEETSRRVSAEAAAADARRQMATIAEQTAHALQERDSTLARFSEWEKERQRLMEVIRKKDEMVSLLSSTFQGALKKGS